jgi:CRISPR-associated endonuclease Csn1
MKYSLGLDIGVTSVGWAIVDEDKQRIHDLGVRIFERAEQPKNGESLAKPRRDARSVRRRLKRRRQRLNALKRFFIKRSLLDSSAIELILSKPNNPYELRVKGLDEKLTNEELFIALYHIFKRRGYKSNRKKQESKDTKLGSVLSAIGANEALLEDNGYRTVGEALQKDDKYSVHKRNKRSEYGNSFARDDFLKEVKLILAQQQKRGLSLSDSDISELLEARELHELPGDVKVELFYGGFAQRPFMNRMLMQRMIGKCSLETDEPRAPRASYSFELFRLAQDLAHVVLNTKGELRSLTAKEIAVIIAKAHSTRVLKYKTIRSVLKLQSETTFSYIRGKENKQDPEVNTFGEMRFYHDVKKMLSDLPEWQQFVESPAYLDGIGYVLTVEKTDDDIRKALSKVSLPMLLSPDAIEALLSLSYSKFAHISIAALRKITPYIINGETYDKAVVSAGYKLNFHNRSDNHKLPPLGVEDSERITNPVVKRGVSQTIKVINAVVHKYGLPYQIKIECTRELSKNFKDRSAIKRQQDDNHANNQKIVDLIKEHGITTPSGQQIIKYKLYKQQNGQCLYSGQPISLDRLFADDSAYEIDHIVPFSRCGDDGYGNKALVTRAENQNKGNAIPFEAFGNNSDKWLSFKARVESLNLGRHKTRCCLEEKITNRDWSAHALKDTQYITRFLKDYIGNNLAFSDPKKKQRVILPSGSITSYIGKRWGLAKHRDENVLHHARDAALVAVMSQGLVQRFAQYNKLNEILPYHIFTKEQKNITDHETGEILEYERFLELQKEINLHEDNTKHKIPLPWPRFNDEIYRRTKDTSTEELQNELRGFDNYDDSFRLQVKPIFVSRMPNRKASGAAHDATLRSPKTDENHMRTTRIPLSKVKLKDLAMSSLRNSDPQIYEAMSQRLESFDDNPEKAFSEPLYKKDKLGNNVHQVRSIKVFSKQPSGFYINKNRAFVNNGSMVRLEIYKKTNNKNKMEHFFVPVYTHQVSGDTPTKILPQPKGFTDVDDTFTKVATLYPNDYVKIYFGNKVVEGYYVTYDSAAGTISLIKHLSAGKNKDDLVRCSARSAVSIERFDISVIGDNAPRR